MAMDREIENALITCAQAGDLDARNSLVDHHYPFIRLVTRQELGGDESPDEYIGVAAEEFIGAIRGFDAGRGTRLITLAGFLIRMRVRTERYRNRVIVPPKTCNQHTEEIRDAASRTAGICSIDSIPELRVGGDDSVDRLDLIHWCLRQLTDRECDMLSLSTRGSRDEVVGHQFGISRSRANQVLHAAIDKIRAMTEEHRPCWV